MSWTERWFALQYWLAMFGIGTFALLSVLAIAYGIKQDIDKAKKNKEK